VNLEWPSQWKDGENSVLENNLSQSISLENQKMLPEPYMASSLTPSEQLNNSLHNLHNSNSSVSRFKSEDLQEFSNPYEKESETYKAFLEMIKQRTTAEGNEIRIEN